MSIRAVMATTALLACVFAAPAAMASPSNVPPPSGAFYSLTGQPLSISYVNYNTSFVAGSASTFLTFAMRDDPGYILLDDVSLTTGGGPNLLTNGGFESGPLGASAPAGWTYLNIYGASAGGIVDNTDSTRCGAICVEGSFPHSGSNEYSDGAIQAYDAITQVVPTTMGATYDVSFWVAETSGIAMDYQPLSTNGDVSNDLGNGIDLLVYQGSTIPSVPEPATWAMMLTGFGLTGAALRSSRKRRLAAA
jgi:hypothetical protein